MERPLENTDTAMLWRTVFSVIVDLPIRPGLFTAEELTPSMGGAPPGRGSVPSDDHLQEEHESEPPGGEDAGHELEEESAREDAPIVDLMAEEPDAEAEPVVSGGSGMNSSAARTASLVGGGGFQCDQRWPILVARSWWCSGI